MAAQAFHYMSYVEGVYTDVAPHLVPDSALYLMDNVVTSYKIGSILKRLGYSKVGATLQSGKSITGLHNFRQSAATQKMIATVNDSSDTDLQFFYKTAAGAWTAVAAAEVAWANKANCKAEMADFIGYCFIVGWDTTAGFLAPRSFTGTTFGTTNTTSMPSAKYILRYRDRLYVLNCNSSGTDYPYRAYFSDVPVAGVITWTPASDFLDVDYSEEITGGGTNWDRLVLFTEYSAYMYNQTEFKQVWDVGCSAHRTIKNSSALMIWANSDGVWVSASGGRPENVAGRVIDFFRFSDPTTWFAEVVSEEYYIYVGSVTVNGVSYTKCRLVLNIPSMTWRVEETFDTFSVFARYYSGGKNYLYMGASDGDVHVQSKYTDTTPIYADDGNPIHSWFQTGAWSLGDPSTVKRLAKILAYSDRAQDLQIKARIVNQNTMATTRFTSLGQLKNYINEFAVNPDPGHFLQIEGVEFGSQPYWSVMGFSALMAADEQVKA